MTSQLAMNVVFSWVRIMVQIGHANGKCGTWVKELIVVLGTICWTIHQPNDVFAVKKGHFKALLSSSMNTIVEISTVV